MNAHQPKKRFGQHFLHDPQVVAKIVRAINPRPGETLIEIGPGLGALTLPLLATGVALHVVEIDRDVLPQLEALRAGYPQLQVHAADALRVDYRQLSAQRPLRLVGNLPYNISTPLLFHLLQQAEAITDMHFMLQKEVVDRMAAAPGSRDYGRLTVSLAARAEVLPLFRVGPGAFRPPPQVDSAVVRLRPRPAPFPLPDPQAYDRLVTAAFGQRRKTLANAVRTLLTADAIRAAGIAPEVRAEQLSPAEFGRLAQQLPASE